MRRTGIISLVVMTVFLVGCAETPKQPVMRPIPPPPPTPPPGAVYSAPAYTVNTNALPPMIVSTSTPPASIAGSVPPQGTNGSGLEVSSNFVGNAQNPVMTPGPGQAPAQLVPPAAQYEVVPPRPGPDYIWKDGYWQWNNGWVWVPGTWVYAAPSVIIVPEPWYYHRPYYRYRRW